MRKIFNILVITFFVFTGSCSKDEPQSNGTTNSNNSSVTIKSDGSTSSGAIYAPYSDDSFYLDYILYKIVESHIEIVGYDPIEISKNAKPYANITYQGVSYKTRKIGKSAFNGCNNIETISIPNTVVEIGSGAFRGCENLVNISLPNGVSRIEESTFNKCNNLNNIEMSNNVEYIGPTAFYNCKSLHYIKLPDAINYIGRSAFEGCSNLKIDVKNIGVWCNIQFDYNTGYNEEKNPLSLDSIYLCINGDIAKDIIFDNTVSQINKYAFYDYDILEKIDFKNSKTTSIGAGAFIYCDSLKVVNIGDSIKIIDVNAFWMCKKLETLNLGKNVEEIKDSAFGYCSSLKSINCYAINPPKLTSYSIDHYTYVEVVHVPKGCKEVYEKAPVWRNKKIIDDLE